MITDAKWVYRAIRLARPGGLGEVPDQDISREPTMNLKGVMALAAERDLIARQYANGFENVLHEALPALQNTIAAGHSLETAIIGAYLNLLARHPDSLIARKYGLECATEVSRRAAELLEAGWPDHPDARARCEALDSWLRQPDHRFNPGTTADLVTAALYAGLRDGTIHLPLAEGLIRSSP
jgi:triphosphoribosyl-dephospho-CoA synthase